ncbi:Histone-lysine N-methyltransferase SETD1B-like protein [Hirschfeldia incana]|nr:Histone-lysine N-methyltransferase SETD1B-like protein [Hirschfeldia incana]
MASQRHLKDLLEEDQEPFQLQSYISDRRCQINAPVTHLQVKKRRAISQNAGLSSSFRRNACFFSLRGSPDPKKSPLFEPKSPNRSQNAMFVNIPARTASMLLEAAVRIQKQSSSDGTKARTRNAGNAFGLFGSVLKKLTHRKKREISGGNEGGRVKDMLRWESPVVRKIVTRKSKRNEEEETQNNASESQFSRRSSSSGVWSESVANEERSYDCDFETSISYSSGSEGLDEFASELMNGADFSEDKRFCESPFHFVLETMPSPSGFKTPNFSSPAASPRHDCQEMKKESYEVEDEEEEEDKEQSSPVSVLDPPFQDDDEDIHMDDNNITSSFRSVQKAKHLLLQKLCRFEQLAGLDPLELEKRMSDQEDEEEEEVKSHYQCEIITQRVVKTYFEDTREVPEGIEALISDLVAEELHKDSFMLGGEAQVTKRVCERLGSWRDVESNTIDMMVEHDFRIESLGSWRSKNDVEVSEVVLDIEFEIYEDLVDELSQEIGGERW